MTAAITPDTDFTIGRLTTKDNIPAADMPRSPICSLSEDQKTSTSSTTITPPLSPSETPTSTSLLTTTTEPKITYLDGLRSSLATNFHTSKIPFFTNQLAEELLESYSLKSERSMLPTATLVPSRNEKGTVLVIDLGGSSLKISIIQLLGSSKYNIICSETLEINNDYKIINLNFFRMIADKTSNILNRYNKNGEIFKHDEVIKCGISWSFPIEQTKPNNGFITVVSKGYQLTDETEGKDLAELFETVLWETQKIKVKVNGIINDAVAVYVSGLYLSDCSVGLVLGTGLNASFKLGNTILNPELAYFGSFFADQVYEGLDLKMIPNFPIIKGVKIHVYANSPTFQPLEYLTGGRYIGELFRIAVASMIESNEIFTSQIINESSPLLKPYAVNGAIVSHLFENDYNFACNLIEKEFELQLSLEDHEKLRLAIDSIISRASLLIAVSVFGILQVLSEDDPSILTKDVIRIGFVGSTLQHFNSFRAYVNTLLKTEHAKLGFPSVELVHIDNSSILGAAIAAASFEEQCQ